MSNEMTDTLTEALKASGRFLLGFYNKPLTQKTKESQSSIVTEADFESDKCIKAIIRDRFPSHNIISEETGFRNNYSEFTWVIDPLDGTSNFAAGIPWFGVLITVFNGDIPVMGGAYLPVTDTMYFTEKGKGVLKDGRKLPMLPEKALIDSLFAFSIDYSDDLVFLNRAVEIYLFLVRNSRNLRSTNCLFDLLYVIEGKFGGLINLYERIWDVAGLNLMISELGGVVQDINGNELQYKISEEISALEIPLVAGNRSIITTLNKNILKRD